MNKRIRRKLERKREKIKEILRTTTTRNKKCRQSFLVENKSKDIREQLFCYGVSTSTETYCSHSDYLYRLDKCKY